MDCSESSDLSNASPSISGRTANSVKTKNADFEDNMLTNQIEDNPDVDIIIEKESKDLNDGNEINIEEAKIITPSELSDLTSKESTENNAQSLNQESSYKKGPTPSLFNEMTEEQWNQKLLDIILISLFIF